MSYKAKKDHAPIDENVVIPAAIRAASARADAIHKQAYETPAEPPVTQQEPPPAEPPVTQQEPPQTPPPVTPPPQTPPPQVDENSVDYWRNNYNAMKGRYDRQEGTINGLTSRIGQLEGLLASRPATPPPAPVTPPELTFNPISKEEIETYGEEFVSVAERAALAKLAPEITSLRNEIATLKGTQQQRTEADERKALADLYTALDSGEPNWRALNRDPKFLAWANLTDQYSGVTRMQMLRDAFNRFDAKRVLTFFKGFLSDEAATSPSGALTTEIPPGKVPLESLAAPGRAKASATQSVPEEKETISTAQITSFYVSVARGDYKGREEEKNRLEQMIFDAQRDGRVV